MNHRRMPCSKRWRHVQCREIWYPLPVASIHGRRMGRNCQYELAVASTVSNIIIIMFRNEFDSISIGHIHITHAMHKLQVCDTFNFVHKRQNKTKNKKTCTGHDDGKIVRFPHYDNLIMVFTNIMLLAGHCMAWQRCLRLHVMRHRR